MNNNIQCEKLMNKISIRFFLYVLLRYSNILKLKYINESPITLVDIFGLSKIRLFKINFYLKNSLPSSVSYYEVNHIFKW